MITTLQHPRYHFDRWIAAGGMGEVWQATDLLLDREVAVKVLRREYAQDPVLRARFAAEARHAGSLQHRNVASVLDYGEITSDGQAPPLPFLVMELVEGQSLSALLADGQPLGPGVAADLISQAADGIEAAHALGIVHRDVKPGNLLVTPSGQVKVTDFGVARAVDGASLTVTGHVIGTPHYLSPEQAEGGSATTVSDVYSLGIVLYECLTGRKPFSGESAVATALMQIRDPLPPFPPGVPERLERIARVATAKAPSDRFRSAGAMAAALRDESPDTRSIPLPVKAVAAGFAMGTAGGSTVAPASRRTPGLRLALAGLLALLLVAGGVWALSVPEVAPAVAPEASASDAAEPVRVRAADYVGEPGAQVTRELRALGLAVTRTDRSNPGDRAAGTVAAVSPTGLVEPGTRVTLSVWSAAPEPAAPADNGAADNGSVAPGPKPSQPGGNGPGSKSAQGSKPGPSGPGQGKAAHGGGNGKSNDKGKSGTKGNKGGNSGKGGGKPAGGPGKGGKR